MSKVKLKHASGNSMSIAAPATNPASDLELKLPATIGTAGQVLKNSSTPGTLEFGAAGGNTVKLHTETISSSVDEVNFHGHFDDSTYAYYMLQILGLSGTNDSSNSSLKLRMQTAENTEYTSSNYSSCNFEVSQNSSANSHADGGAFDSDYFEFSWNNIPAATSGGLTGYAYFYFPQSTTYNLTYFNENFAPHGSGPAWYRISIAGAIDDTSQTYTGFAIYPHAGQLDAGTLILYGVKK